MYHTQQCMQCIICSWGPRQTDAGSQLQQRGRFQPIHHLHHLFLLILMLMFAKFNAFSTLRFWWLLQLRFHFGLPTFSRDLLHLLFAQLVSRRFDSKTVTRMTQGPSVNPDARCTLSEGFAARILPCKWHTFIILATSLSHQKIFLYEFHPTTLFLKTQVEKDSSGTCAASKVWISSKNSLLCTTGL